MGSRVTKKQLIERWKDPEFLANVQEPLHRIFQGREFSDAVDLRGIALGVEGALKSLEAEHFWGVNLDYIDLSYSRFSCQFNRSQFKEIKFSKSQFDTCSMMNSVFHQCDFNESHIWAPDFDGSILERCNFHSARLYGRGIFCTYGARKAVFQSCDFSKALVRKLQFRACQFKDCSFEDTIFQKCFIFNVTFEGNNPTQDQFEECEFRGRNIGILDV